MKPIVIVIDKDGKLDISVEEIKKLMDDAYWTGYHDASTSSLTNTYADKNKWWNELQFGCASVSTQEGK